jgi:hypothetical protein
MSPMFVLAFWLPSTVIVHRPSRSTSRGAILDVPESFRRMTSDHNDFLDSHDRTHRFVR